VIFMFILRVSFDSDYLQWFVKHPEFISNPFYVGGDSYSGKIVPGAVQQISLGSLFNHHFSQFWYFLAQSFQSHSTI